MIGGPIPVMIPPPSDLEDEAEVLDLHDIQAIAVMPWQPPGGDPPPGGGQKPPQPKTRPDVKVLNQRPQSGGGKQDQQDPDGGQSASIPPEDGGGGGKDQKGQPKADPRVSKVVAASIDRLKGGRGYLGGS